MMFISSGQACLMMLNSTSVRMVTAGLAAGFVFEASFL